MNDGWRFLSVSHLFFEHLRYASDGGTAHGSHVFLQDQILTLCFPKEIKTNRDK